MTLLHGTRLGPYEVVAPLGSGGMSGVHRARDTRPGREVALLHTRFVGEGGDLVSIENFR